MPVRRRYAKRTFKRRKTYRRKKSMMRRRRTADKGHLEKITQTYAFVVSGGQCNFTANWLATGVAGAPEAFITGGGGSINTQFQQCATMYKEYYISSMKIEYRPCHLDAGNTGGFVISAGITGTTMDALLATPIADTQFRGALDCKMFDAGRQMKRFYRVSKYAKQKSLIWRSCADAIGGGGTGGFNALPNCQTNILVPTSGLANGTQVADIFVTYYVRFHHRTRV